MTLHIQSINKIYHVRTLAPSWHVQKLILVISELNVSYYDAIRIFDAPSDCRHASTQSVRALLPEEAYLGSLRKAHYS